MMGPAGLGGRVAQADAKTVKQLYAALQARDGEAMAACYAPDARFSDPVFRDLHGAEIGAMWRMLCAQARELRVEVRGVKSKGGMGEATWEAWYSFPGRDLPVRNVGTARFALRDGLIVTHVDDWHFHKWAAQALGAKGKWLGWTKPFHEAVSRDAMRRLERFMGKGT